MLRIEHNAKWTVSRQPNEQVNCNLFGYGELSQYDGRCVACWHGHVHSWDKHDRWIANKTYADTPALVDKARGEE
jgi:hypothetical protein